MRMYFRHIQLIFVIFALILSGCGANSANSLDRSTAQISPQAVPPTSTSKPTYSILTPITATVATALTVRPALTEFPTLTPVPRGVLNPFSTEQTAEELANAGEHDYRYACYAWWPCSCPSIAPSQISLTVTLLGPAVTVGSEIYEMTYTWYAENTYIQNQETLLTQLHFFAEGIEFYSTIDESACRLESYTLISGD